MSHAQKAAAFQQDSDRLKWHDQAVWYLRSRRDKAVFAVPEWEQLREIASQIKAHTMSRLADYLEQFERNAKRIGAQIHWACDADAHNRIVHEILASHEVTRVVKSKSMLTEECGMNQHLERHGIQVTDTDLGERIVQLRKEPPSHLVAPAIHLRRSDVAELFHEQLGTDKESEDPNYLVQVARRSLRDHFLEAQAAISGVNFAVAETGGVIVCTNEGNADMGTSLPKLHIASMGIEKLIPRAKDLGVFLRLLARATAGQPITSYTSHFHGPIPGGQLHIVIVDNGRSEVLKQDQFRRSLNCIRCGACMNTCPVYRRSGGHSYGFTVPGPIGSVLAPSRDMKKFYDLPYASSLCGSCTDVCPVKIDLHHQLLAWRSQIAAAKVLPWRKRTGMKVLSIVLRNPWFYNLAGRVIRWFLRRAPRFVIYNRMNVWGRQREMPSAPRQTFRQMYRRR